MDRKRVIGFAFIAALLVISVVAVSGAASAISFGELLHRLGGKITGREVSSGSVGGSGAITSGSIYYGSISINVVDSSGDSRVQNAVVTLAYSSTTYRGVFTSSGIYSFINIPSASYQLKVTASGYDNYVHPSNIQINPGNNNLVTVYIKKSQTTSTTTITCTDSDNGAVRYVKGSTSGIDYTTGHTVNKVDYCTSTGIMEFYCQDNKVITYPTTCPYGCGDGRCLAAGTGTNQTNVTTSTCTDSDGGVNLTQKGEINYFYNVSTDFFYGWHITEDTCDDGKTLNEYSCSYYNHRELNPSKKFDCPNGCFDGACIESNTSSGNASSGDDEFFCLNDPNKYWDQQTQRCYKEYSDDIRKGLCSDPDGGKDIYEYAHTFGFRSVFADDKDKRIRTGGADGCLPGNVIREHYCTEDGFISSFDQECPSGFTCSNGACLPNLPGTCPASVAATISEGAVSEVEFNGKKYDISIEFISSTRVKLRVDGVGVVYISKALVEGESVVIDDYITIYIEDINGRDQTGTISNVEIVLAKPGCDILGEPPRPPGEGIPTSFIIYLHDEQGELLNLNNLAGKIYVQNSRGEKYEPGVSGPAAAMYIFRGVPTGNYEVIVEMAGYEKYKTLYQAIPEVIATPGCNPALLPCGIQSDELDIYLVAFTGESGCIPNVQCKLEPRRCPASGEQNRICRDTNACVELGDKEAQEKIECTPYKRPSLGQRIKCLFSKNYDACISIVTGKFIIESDIGVFNFVEGSVESEGEVSGWFSGFEDGASGRYKIENAKFDEDVIVVVNEYDHKIAFEEFNDKMTSLLSNDFNLDYDTNPFKEDEAVLFIQSTRKGNNGAGAIWTSGSVIVLLYVEDYKSLSNEDKDFAEILKQYLKKYPSSIKTKEVVDLG